MEALLPNERRGEPIDLLTFLKLVLIVAAVLAAMQTRAGRQVGRILPTPFWIYFIPILGTTVGLLPPQSSAYEFIAIHLLPTALFLMLIGTPVKTLLKMGPQASTAMAIAAGSMILATLISFAAFVHWLPAESHKSAGALLATWIGGSANMVAVKEIVNISDAAMAPLIIVDTVLSYTWMAILILAAGYQAWFNRRVLNADDVDLESKSAASLLTSSETFWSPINFLLVAGAGILMAEVSIVIGKFLGGQAPLLSGRGWTVLVISILAVVFALTPMTRLEQRGASKWGMLFLYLVLTSIGAKTSLNAAVDAPRMMLLGAAILFLHGVFSVVAGRIFKIPLYLLATASQANVGGAVSAPIVAGVYRPGVAHVGVLMAVLGTLVGTYAGVLGSWLCGWIEKWLA